VNSPLSAQPAIAVRDLVKRFDDVVAVNGISFDIAAGSCVGLLGPNGAGKTTTVEILEGVQSPTSGEVTVLGRSWRSDPEGIRQRIGLALQQTQFYERLTVAETVRLFRSFYRTGLTVEEAIALVQLQEKAGAHVMKLSGGQRQRLAVAVALVADPELLFLDEPTTGLDPQSRRSLWDVIEALRGKGRTVVLTTHYMEEAARLCDRIIIVDRGKIVADGTVAQLIASTGGEQVIEVTTRPALDDEAVKAVPGLARVTRRGDTAALTVQELHVAVPAVLQAVQQAGAAMVQLSTRQSTLDDVFLALTGHSLREDES
jgi:ABC-2 type transport system ATP-binding protein